MHSERAHARLSASGSKRWLTCTPSPRLEDGFPEESSSFALEGTTAHELAENRLKFFLFKDAVLTDGDAEMIDHVGYYTNFVIERYHAALAETLDAIILLEQRLDFSNWVPDGFGTGDVVIISDNVLEVIDLKYGKGVPVSAKDNSQMMLYALGAIHSYHAIYGFEKVKMTIVQPRLDSISTDEKTVEELLKWAEEYIKPRADLAIRGEGDFVAGDHCRFCRARFQCRARAEDNLKMAQYEFKNAELLEDHELADILNRAEALSKWVNDISNYTLKRALDGKQIEGWKLVEGQSKRKIADEKEAAKVLLSEGYSEDSIFSKSLQGIGALEKLIGKARFKEMLEPFVIKPQGKLTLVPDEDKRNVYSSAKGDFS